MISSLTIEQCRHIGLHRWLMQFDDNDELNLLQTALEFNCYETALYPNYAIKASIAKKFVAFMIGEITNHDQSTTVQ